MASLSSLTSRIPPILIAATDQSKTGGMHDFKEDRLLSKKDEPLKVAYSYFKKPNIIRYGIDYS